MLTLKALLRCFTSSDGSWDVAEDQRNQYNNIIFVAFGVLSLISFFLRMTVKTTM